MRPDQGGHLNTSLTAELVPRGEGAQTQQMLIFPLQPDYDNYMIGVSIIPAKAESYQFIFKNGDRTQAADTTYKKAQWQDVVITAKKIIAKVTIMFDKTDSCIYGLKFEDKRGYTLLKVGKIDEWVTKPGIGVRSVTLHEGERLVGVRSSQCGFLHAPHFDLQFVIGRL